jgi:CBS domain-containing protein
MKTAANVLKSKAHQSVHTIAPEASVFDALKLMADKNIGALLVVEAGESPASSRSATTRVRWFSCLGRLSRRRCARS